MVRILWEECLPESYLKYLKRPENFELIHSEKVNFKHIKNIVGVYMRPPENCRELIVSFQKYHDIYQYIYAHLFPKTYSNKAGFQKKMQFQRYLDFWKQKKMQGSFGKNPFNFAAPDVQRHPMEQQPITQEIDIYDDLEFKADVVDTKSKNKTGKEGNTPLMMI